MYDQSVVIFIHEFIGRIISETSRIISLYIGDMSNNADHVKARLILILKEKYGSFLGGYFSILEKIIDDNIKDSMTIYPAKLREVEKTINTQYKRLELGIQAGLSKSTSLDHFKSIIDIPNNEVISKIQAIDNKNENTHIHEQLIIGIQNKIDTYFVNIGLTNQDICNEIKQKVDLYQNNFLDILDEKTSALTYLGNNNIKMLYGTAINKLGTISNLVTANDIAMPGPSISKI